MSKTNSKKPTLAHNFLSLIVPMILCAIVFFALGNSSDKHPSVSKVKVTDTKVLDAKISNAKEPQAVLPTKPLGFDEITDGCEKKIYEEREWTGCERFLFLTPPLRGYFEAISGPQKILRKFSFAGHPYYDGVPVSSAQILKMTKTGWKPVKTVTDQFKDDLSFAPCKSYKAGCDFPQNVLLDTSELAPDLYLLKFKFDKIKEVRDRNAAFPFIVLPNSMDDASSRVLVYPNWTHQSYVRTGGGSMYKRFTLTETDGKTIWSNFTFDDDVSLQRPVEGVRVEHRYNVATPLLSFLKSEDYTYTIISQEDYDDYVTRKDTDTVMLFGHNEYWTKKNAENTQQYLEQGGDIINLSGNTMWWWLRHNGNILSLGREEARDLKRAGDVAQAPFMPLDLQPQALLGVNFATGGYPVGAKQKNVGDFFPGAEDLEKAVQEFTPLCVPTWLEDAGLIAGEKFGGDAMALRVEVDGVPINQKTNAIDPNFAIDPESKLRVIAHAPAFSRTPYFNYLNITTIPSREPYNAGMITEYVYRGKGRVLSIPSVGATMALTGDTDDHIRFRSIVSSMLTSVNSEKQDDSDILGCPWFQYNGGE